MSSAKVAEHFPAVPAKLPRDVLHIAILLAIAAYFLIFPIYRSFFPLEIGVNESWTAYHQDLAAGAGPLYPPPDSLIFTNYPPLSFYVVAWISKWTGDPLYVGRALSVAAAFGISWLIGIIIGQLGGGRTAVIIGAVWFIAFMAGTFDQFIGMDDPQLPAQVMMVGALAWFLSRDARGLSAEPPILLLVIAGFWKHNLVAIPITVMLWLVFRDGRRAWRPILFGAVCAALGLALCVAIYGQAFIANLMAPRFYSALRVPIALGRLQWVLPALVIWAIWAWRERHTRAARFTALFSAVALVSYLFQWFTDVSNNAQFDLDIATAIGLGLAYEHAWLPNWSTAGVRNLIVAVVGVRLLATGHVESGLILFDPDYRRTVAEHAAVARAEADRVARAPGPAGCDNMLVCRMAGKAFVFDEAKRDQSVKSGATTPQQLNERMRAEGITRFAIDPRATAESIRRDWLEHVFRGTPWN